MPSYPGRTHSVYNYIPVLIYPREYIKTWGWEVGRGGEKEYTVVAVRFREIIGSRECKKKVLWWWNDWYAQTYVVPLHCMFSYQYGNFFTTSYGLLLFPQFLAFPLALFVGIQKKMCSKPWIHTQLIHVMKQTERIMLSMVCPCIRRTEMSWV